jgi:PAS domain S-box-containing protein
VTQVGETQPAGAGRRVWATYRSALEGAASGAAVFGVICVCLIALHWLGLGALRTQVRDSLTQTAVTVAALVDGGRHAEFVSAEQEASPAYREAVVPLRRILHARRDIRFLYTMALVSNRACIVLDATPPGDADHDGVEDHSPLMQPYDGSAPALLDALRTGKAQADPEPVTDRWGTYLSAYAPIRDPAGRQTGVVGVDIRADTYAARLLVMRQALQSCVLLALLLSVLLGAVVWRLRRSARRSARDQQSAEEARLAVEARYRQLFEQILDGYALHELIVDDKGRPVDYRFLAVNPAFERLTGLSAGRVIGRTVREVLPGTESHWIETYGRVVQTGIPATFENYSRELDRYFEVSAFRAAPGQFACVFADATARRRALDALREREQRYRQLVEALTDALLVHTIRTDGSLGPIIEVNDEACRRLGYSRDELLGRTPLLFEAQDSGVDTVAIVNRLRAGETVAFEQTHVAKDGRRIPVEIHARAITLGEQPVVLSLIRDITERKEHERLQKQMLQTQKLEGLGLLAGGIAHDFNNLLMGVLGNADLALEDLDERSPVREQLQRIRTTALQAAELCRQLLAYAGKGRFVLDPLDLSNVVREMANLVQVSVSRSAVLRFNLAADMPTVKADAAQIRQVVLNLVTNASEAVGDRSGVISVSTGAMDCDEAYLKAAYAGDDTPPGSYAYVEVADTGCGMDADTQSRVFDPFFTTKFTGRGLGLAAVLGIVRSHRGVITIRSEIGKGSTFRVLFPALTQPAPAVGADAGQASDWRGQGRVLLVEDEEHIRWLAKQMLQKIGFEVAMACDGREAVSTFGRDPASFVCVLMDLTMPHMDGYTAFRELRRIQPDVKVILMSGYSEKDIGERFSGSGLAGFLAKPYPLTELRGLLRRVVG